jgi:hypothetical protein
VTARGVQHLAVFSPSVNYAVLRPDGQVNIPDDTGFESVEEFEQHLRRRKPEAAE